MEEDGSANSLFVIDGVAGGGGGNVEAAGAQAVAQDYASDSDGDEEPPTSAVDAAAESLDDAMVQLQQLQQMEGTVEMQPIPDADSGGAAGRLGYVKAGIEQDGQPIDEKQAQALEVERGAEEEDGYLSDE